VVLQRHIEAGIATTEIAYFPHLSILHFPHFIPLENTAHWPVRPVHCSHLMDRAQWIARSQAFQDEAAMSRIMFALAVVVAFASTSTAEDKPAAAPAPAPVVVAAPLTSTYVPTTTSTRRGLFGRLRGRNVSTVMSATPAMSGTIITAPAPATTVPATMPSTTAPKTTGGAAVTGNPVVVAGGTTTPGKVVPAGMMTPGTPVVTSEMVSTTTAKRMGLFARLRARR